MADYLSVTLEIGRAGQGLFDGLDFTLTNQPDTPGPSESFSFRAESVKQRAQRPLSCLRKRECTVAPTRALRFF